MNNKKYCTYTFSKVAFSLWICLFKMSISPRANCNFSLSPASLAFVRTWFSFSSYYKWQMANKWNNIQLVEWKHANLHCIVTSILNYNNIKKFKLSGYHMLYLGQCEESSIVIMQNSEILIKEILLKRYLGDSCM